jgi:hypothetical protein
MNAATVCKMTIEPTSRTQFSANPIWRPKISNSIRGGRRRSPSRFRLPTRSSLIIETVEGQAPSESDSIPRRLILLRHAESSWEYPSLRGRCMPLLLFIIIAFLSGNKLLAKACRPWILNHFLACCIVGGLSYMLLHN